jgi:hypothetical protein
MFPWWLAVPWLWNRKRMVVEREEDGGGGVAEVNHR